MGKLNMILHQWINSTVLLVVFCETFLISLTIGIPFQNNIYHKELDNDSGKDSGSPLHEGYRTNDLNSLLNDVFASYDYQETERPRPSNTIPNLNKKIPYAAKVKLNHKDECTLEKEGRKRIGKNQMHFVDYDLCSNGKWEKKSCDKGSLFWVITNCCIPIEKYPTFDECLPMREDKNV